MTIMLPMLGFFMQPELSAAVPSSSIPSPHFEGRMNLITSFSLLWFGNQPHSHNHKHLHSVYLTLISLSLDILNSLSWFLNLAYWTELWDEWDCPHWSFFFFLGSTFSQTQLFTTVLNLVPSFHFQTFLFYLTSDLLNSSVASKLFVLSVPVIAVWAPVITLFHSQRGYCTFHPYILCPVFFPLLYQFTFDFLSSSIWFHMSTIFQESSVCQHFQVSLTPAYPTHPAWKYFHFWGSWLPWICLTLWAQWFTCFLLYLRTCTGV